METKKFGLQAEEWIISILKKEGFVVVKATHREDHFYKIDFWVKHNGSYLAIQFSVDKEAIMSWEGTESLQRGIIPMWIDGDKLKEIIEGEEKEEEGLVKRFWDRVGKVVDNFSIKRFRSPHWDSI